MRTLWFQSNNLFISQPGGPAGVVERIDPETGLALWRYVYPSVMGLASTSRFLPRPTVPPVTADESPVSFDPMFTPEGTRHRR